jgi:pilus assembly protein CpaE
MADQLQVLLIDEDADSRVAARKALQRAELGVAGETGFGTQAVSLAIELRPDVAMIAVEEPAARALETAEALADALPDTPLVVYSSESGADAVRRGMILGARDYVLKPVNAPRLREAVSVSLGHEERRQMRRAGQVVDRFGRGTVVTVTGAKGGIGKTVLSVNLAVALREQTGSSVAIVDADTQFGDVATMLDLPPGVALTDAIRDAERINRDLVGEYVTSHASGVDTIGGTELDDAWSDSDPESLKLLIDAFARVYDFVIVDTSGSFDRFVRASVEAATLTLIVTSADVSSIRNTKAALDRLEHWGIDTERTRFIFNRSTPTGSVSRSELHEALGRDVLLEIPFDKAVASSVQLGMPVVLRAPRSRAAQDLRALAGRIAGSNGSAGTSPSAAPRWRSLLQRRATA